MKVYCKNCEWDMGFCYCKLGFNVLSIVKEHLGPKAYEKMLGRPLFSRQINKNHDCPYYKRKWWKIWLLTSTGGILL